MNENTTPQATPGTASQPVEVLATDVKDIGRLMLVGSDREDAIENFFVKYIRRHGGDLFFFPAHTLFHEYYYGSFRHKLFFRAGLSGIYRRINRRFRQAVEEFRPNVIWVFKGMELYPETLRWARQQNIRLVNFNPDNPFIFSGKGSGNSNITGSIGLYDLHFTYNLDIKQQLEGKGYRPAFLLPFGFDITPEEYDAAASQEEIVRTCFLGNPDALRADFITDLASRGIPMDIYGRDWSKWLDHPNIRIFPPVYGVEMWRVLRRYRVQLNIMRIHNLDSHNMRSFEVPAIGGIMLAPDTREHRVFFENGKEAFWYNNVTECAALAQQIMELPPAEAAKIRERARQRSVISGYSYESRTLQALAKINNPDA